MLIELDKNEKKIAKPKLKIILITCESNEMARIVK